LDEDALRHSLEAAMRASGEAEDDLIALVVGHPAQLYSDLRPDPHADAAIEDLERQPLRDADVSTIRAIIAETKDQERRRSMLTWQVVDSQHCAAAYGRRGQKSA